MVRVTSQYIFGTVKKYKCGKHPWLSNSTSTTIHKSLIYYSLIVLQLKRNMVLREAKPLKIIQMLLLVVTVQSIVSPLFHFC